MSDPRNAFMWRASALAIAITAAAGASVPVTAQESPRAGGLEEIVVTAQRREESLQDTPIAITAFTADKMTDMGITNASQIADFSPNVTIQKQPSSNSNMSITIRGMGMNETALLADPKVGMYIDGILISKSISAVFDIADLERIEVLRGPQGTLFGRNTTGGAINVTTRKPSGELRGKAQVSTGNFGYLRYGGNLDLPAVGDLAASVAFNHTETDGWARNDYRGPALAPQRPGEKLQRNLASEDNDAYRLALRWTPRDDLTFDYAFDRTDNSGVAAPFQILKVKDALWNGFRWTPADYRFLSGAGGLYDQMAQNVHPRSKRQEHFSYDESTEEYVKINAHTFIAAWDVQPNLTLKYLFGSRRSRHNNGSDLDGGVYYARDLFYGGGDRVQVPGFHSRIDKAYIDMDSHEFQFIGSALDDQLHYTGGIYTYKEEVYEHNPQTFSLPLAFVATSGASTPFLGPLYDSAGFCPAMYGGTLCIGTQRIPLPFGDSYVAGVNDFEYGQTAKSRAAYGQATYSITDALDLTLGIRYTKDKKNAFLYSQNIERSVPGHSIANPLRGKGDWHNTSYMGNLNYQLTDEIRVYFTYATGYNGGGLNARAATRAAFETPYDEEEVKSFEIGMKSELFDNRLRLNVAAFHNEYADMQVAQSELGTGGASSKIVNAGEATLKGIEFDIVAVPLDGLTIDLSYGYIDAKFNEFIARDPATDQLVDISDVARVPMTSRNNASLGVQYDFEPFSFGALSARVDVAYQSPHVQNPINYQWDSPGSRTLLNARISLNDINLGSCCDDKSRLRVSLWGKNLTDEEYINFGIDFGAIGWAGAVYGEPRTYGFDVVYTYD
ncbi:MAG: TonB-dependent receptor [Pseudomonadales bacterium]|jgi:iron complex outermembrane receptor protein|nr:TonB-dependent receptor [Pseudomonadales bacterium]MCP5319635.1 TonB-dependent receptor [Pseudomonadales bacterium]MCP5337436.1 TonB-dependent receptor [Pseudomonadales bacterium]